MIDFDLAPSGSPKGSPLTPFGFGIDSEDPAGAGQGGDGPLRELTLETPLEELPPYLKTLNPKQREAALITEGPLMVLAGAGSGKTRMVTARIAYLIGYRRVAPYQILAVTFTNKAAGEMRERVQSALEAEGHIGNPEIGTFHSICVRILRRELERTPFTKPFVIYDDADQLALIKTILKKKNIDPKVINPKAVKSEINGFKCDALEPHEIEVDALNRFAKQIKEVYEHYQKELFANNALDFGEILCLTYRLLRDHPDIRAKYQKRFRYIHVDEYQDTNRAQYLLLSALAGEKFGGHKNICVVGDEDQSIYAWRGADIRNILEFEKDYPGAQIVKLEQNYRSTKTIISAASQVISNNTGRKEKTLWTDNKTGMPICQVQCPDERVEAETVVGEIKRLALGEGYSYNDFAIFYRTHAQSRQFEDILRREKIAYQIVGGVRFYDRKEIKDILSYLKVLMNPSDSVSLKRIINVPARGIGKTTVDKLEQRLASGDVSPQGELLDDTASDLWSVVVQAASGQAGFAARTATKLGVFVQKMSHLMEQQPKLPLSELYHLILDETAYVRDLKAEGTPEALARIENLEELDNMFQEFEDEVRMSLPEDTREEDFEALIPQLLPMFLERSALVSDNDQSFDLSAIKLMTLHGAKGLEFPVAFMVGMEEGLFPSVRGWEEPSEEEIEEERRLCYVGMTRAKERLFMTHAQMRRIWGNLHYQEPARFFSEFNEEFVDFRNLAQTQQKFKKLHPAARPSGSTQSSAGFYDSTTDAVYSPGFSSSDHVGKRIHHPDYGGGTIMSVEGKGDQQKVTIEFQGRVKRKFLFRYLKNYLE